MKWSTETKAKYGTVPNYVMEERLKWMPLPSSTPESGPKFAIQNPVPFANKQDYKIMPNDWPYGMAPGRPLKCPADGRTVRGLTYLQESDISLCG
jgi:Protein of unknown function (DUF3605)